MKIPFGYCGKIRNSNMIFSSYPLKNIIFPRSSSTSQVRSNSLQKSETVTPTQKEAPTSLSASEVMKDISRGLPFFLNFNSRISLSWNLEVICQTVSPIFQALRYVSSLYAQSYSPPSASTYSRRIRGKLMLCEVRPISMTIM